jgi:hypothetical protein
VKKEKLLEEAIRLQKKYALTETVDDSEEMFENMIEDIPPFLDEVVEFLSS